MFGTQFPADSLRQLIHELRTPLNAIIGFAEMIEGQYMGPAAAGYRGQAAEIMAQARGLLGAVDDLDTAARLETRRFEHDDGVGRRRRLAVPAARILRAGGARSAAPGIALEIADGPAAGPGRAGRGRADVRPAARRDDRPCRGGRDDRARGSPWRRAAAARCFACRSTGPTRSPASTRRRCSIPATARTATGPARPALGLGFALRLVRNLAEAVGGALTSSEAGFALDLPALATGAAGAAGATAPPEVRFPPLPSSVPPCHRAGEGL